MKRKKKENNDTNNTKILELDPSNYDSTIKINKESQLPYKDDLNNDQQNNENAPNNQINQNKDIKEINFNKSLNNNKQTENYDEINIFSKHEKQFEELTYVKIIDNKINSEEKKEEKTNELRKKVIFR